jgi:4-hydroxythreonine-4-phosphate dehydrogenase
MLNVPCKRILITPGEPAGIGPDIAILAAQRDWPAELIVIADAEMMAARAAQLKCPLQLIPVNLDKHDDVRTPHQAGTLKIIPVALPSQVQPGQLNVAAAEYVLRTLNVAAFLCQEQQANAIVTGPVNKQVINQAGLPFTGHTEFFAQFAQAERTLMLFVVDQLKIALATTHLPLAAVPEAINQLDLRRSLYLLQGALQRQFDIVNPRILVCGLNPHAGEGGYLGREEIDIIAPVISELKTQGMNIEGPLAADTIFTNKYLREADAVLAMYHDQALPLVKYVGFGQAVNVTLGLPFLRTSVDHGTALTVAGTGLADPGSLIAAIELAIKLG